MPMRDGTSQPGGDWDVVSNKLKDVRPRRGIFGQRRLAKGGAGKAETVFPGTLWPSCQNSWAW